MSSRRISGLPEDLKTAAGVPWPSSRPPLWGDSMGGEKIDRKRRGLRSGAGGIKVGDRGIVGGRRVSAAVLYREADRSPERYGILDVPAVGGNAHRIFILDHQPVIRSAVSSSIEV